MKQHDKNFMDTAEIKQLAREMLNASGGDKVGAIRPLIENILNKQEHDMLEHGRDVTFVGTFGSEFHVAALRDRLKSAADIISFDRMGLLLIRELCDTAAR